MKQFILFDSDDYYPQGGLADFAGSYDTEAEATAHARKHDNSWHIVDRDTWRIVAQKKHSNGWTVNQPE